MIHHWDTYIFRIRFDEMCFWFIFCSNVSLDWENKRTTYRKCWRIQCDWECYLDLFVDVCYWDVNPCVGWTDWSVSLLMSTHEWASSKLSFVFNFTPMFNNEWTRVNLKFKRNSICTILNHNQDEKVNISRSCFWLLIYLMFRWMLKSRFCYCCWCRNWCCSCLTFESSGFWFGHYE